MNQFIEKFKSSVRTLNLTLLLMLNLFFIVTLNLTVITVIVLFGADHGFFFNNGDVSIGGALVFLYASCILIAISMVYSIRRVLISPINKIGVAMGNLSSGDFSVRLEYGENEVKIQEIENFYRAFNKTAEELGGNEILKKDFINNFSHEFKTPIVSISGFADLLLEDDVTPEEQRDYLQIIRDESKRLANLSTSILMLNRIESQTILTDQSNFILDEQIRQSILVTEQKWKDKELLFDTKLEPCNYTGNASLLKEVWLNLLDNAAKFSPKSSCISLVLRREDSHIELTFTDQGCGMTEETIKHIFDQFYQGDTCHKTQGNGLGLAMAKKIINLHGGEIIVDSQPDCGSSFVVKLPI